MFKSRSNQLTQSSSPWPTSSEPSSDVEKKLGWRVVRRATRIYAGQFSQEQLNDLYHSACLAMVSARLNYDPTRGVKLTTLMFRYAHNAVVNALSKEGEYQRHKQQYLPTERNWGGDIDSDEQPDDWGEYLGCIDPGYERVDTHIIAVDVHKALTKLTPRQRSIIRGLYWQNMSQVDIARNWGISTSLVRKELKRVEVRLKEIFPKNPFNQ